MTRKKQKNQRFLLTALIVICVGIILAGGLRYIKKLRENLQAQAIQNVMTVTLQQQQAFDNFISGDRERLHSYAEYFSSRSSIDPEDIRQQLLLFDQVDAIYLVICLDEGWICGTSFDDIRQVDEKNLEIYRSLSGNGVRDSYTGLYSGTPRFGFYETFTFSNGHRGLVQKSYDRSTVSETFSLSFYHNQGYAFVINQKGNILLRSIGMISNQLYENIFDIISDIYGQQADVDAFRSALSAQEPGSMIFSGQKESFVYTYVPAEDMEDWYLVSIVPVSAITAETDHILMDSKLTLGLLVLLLILCAVFILLIRRTNKDFMEKEQEIDYQTQLFNIFSTHLSRNTNDVYLLLDLQEHYVEYASPNLERVLGVSSGNLLSRLRELDVAGPSGERVDSECLRRLAPGDKLELLSTEWVNPDNGEHKWFQASVYCVALQGSSKLVLYVSDRTKERKTQASLSEALRMAQAANNAKSAFLSNVSHDIRTPMNAITGFLALMRDAVDNPAMVSEYIQRIDAASQHLLGLINDVLDMNKIESGSATLNISDMDIAEIIEELNSIIRPQARAKNQSFDIFVSRMEYEHLLGDKLRLNQVLINLLSNAVKYTPEGGTIQLRAEELPQVVENYSRLRFTVSDNGLGMSPEYLEVIFDPFTREETEATRQIQGTGLGMAITKSLVDLMGGTIHVESELGKGSTFAVELELCIRKHEDDPAFWADHDVCRMIVADDDEDACRDIVETMSQTGVATDYATDGGTAIQMIRSAREAGTPYDLILLDWKMPNLNGLETARLIRKNYPEHIPILLLTAYDWGEIEQEAMEIGISHFMPKPFFMSTFKEAIRRVMGSKQEKSPQPEVVNGLRILVVDDIEVNRMILVKLLGTMGAECDIAGNGQEAVEKFEASQPGEYDLVLMDIQMPVLNGYDATRAIRGNSHPSAQTVPIIAMTANAFVEDVRDAIEAGMDAHIAKPIQLEKLKETIRQVLEQRSMQK